MRAGAFNPEMVEEAVMALAEDELIFQRSCLFLLAVAAQLWVLEEVFHYLFLCYLQEQQELGERIERHRIAFNASNISIYTNGQRREK